MAKTITQKIVFKNTTPAQLYNLYMDAKKHTEATGDKAKIKDKEGAAFSAGDGYMWGKNLRLIKNKLIVQTWTAADWEGKEESTFILHLEAKGKDAVLYMTHANLPDNHAKHINDGWRSYYWEPWKEYLKGEK
jgi:activator of HSP90 ATPase